MVWLWSVLSRLELKMDSRVMLWHINWLSRVTLLQAVSHSYSPYHTEHSGLSTLMTYQHHVPRAPSHRHGPRRCRSYDSSAHCLIANTVLHSITLLPFGTLWVEIRHNIKYQIIITPATFHWTIFRLLIFLCRLCHHVEHYRLKRQISNIKYQIIITSATFHWKLFQLLIFLLTLNFFWVIYCCIIKNWH